MLAVQASRSWLQDNSGSAPEQWADRLERRHRGQTGTGNPRSRAGNQPFMATGVDLKGPPQQFPGQQTPE